MIRQYDVFKSPVALGGERSGVVVLSPHLLLDLDAVVVAPLISRTGIISDQKLYPSLRLDGDDYTLGIPLLASIRRVRLGTKLGDVWDHADEIDRELARLFTGF